MISRALRTTALAGLALSCAAHAAPQPASELVVSLDPPKANAQGVIPYIDVKIVMAGVSARRGEDFLNLPLVLNNVAGIADSLSLLHAVDAKGELGLVAHDEQTPAGGSRHWSASRDTAGPVTLSYRVPITNAPNARGAAPPLELRSEGGGFSGAGGLFLILPDREQPYRVEVQWKLASAGPGAIGLSTFGPGNTQSHPLPLKAAQQSFFMGGQIGHYPEKLSAEGFASVWQGKPPFDAYSLMRWTKTLYTAYLANFRASAKQPYSVFLRYNPINAGGGVEVGHSFVGTFDQKTDPKDLKLTLAHEMVHTFVGGLDSQSQDLSNSWFSEGIAVYYQNLLPLRAGLLSPTDYLADLNKTAARYYTDLLNTTPNDQIAARFWSDTRIRVLPYDRGAMYFAQLNDQIVKASNGKRSVDDLIQAMLSRRQGGEAMDAAAWLELLRKELGSAGVESFHDMLAGKLVVPGPHAFGACFTRTTARLRRYELGFDTDVLIQPRRIVRGLVPNSAAAQAGIRNGDEIVKPVPQDQIQADQHATLTLLIRRDGKEFPVTYLPRGEAVDAFQWRQVADSKAAHCDSAR